MVYELQAALILGVYSEISTARAIDFLFVMITQPQLLLFLSVLSHFTGSGLSRGVPGDERTFSEGRETTPGMVGLCMSKKIFKIRDVNLEAINFQTQEHTTSNNLKHKLKENIFDLICMIAISYYLQLYFELIMKRLVDNLSLPGVDVYITLHNDF